MTEIKPIKDYVLYQQVIVAMASGIILPGGGKDTDLCKNIVVSVGEDVEGVEVGDEIIVLPKTALALNFPERKVLNDLRIIKQENIIAVMKDSKEA
jgi:co-chaperonin GroES (HSP10)